VGCRSEWKLTFLWPYYTLVFSGLLSLIRRRDHVYSVGRNHGAQKEKGKEKRKRKGRHKDQDAAYFCSLLIHPFQREDAGPPFLLRWKVVVEEGKKKRKERRSNTLSGLLFPLSRKMAVATVVRRGVRREKKRRKKKEGDGKRFGHSLLPHLTRCDLFGDRQKGEGREKPAASVSMSLFDAFLW